MNANPAAPRSRIRVLHLARNYPNPVLPRLGLWTERLVASALPFCDAKVVSPVPYFPPLPGFPQYTRFRRVEPHRWSGEVEIFHPRFFVGPGYSLRRIESATYYRAVRPLIEHLRAKFPFDLIHAHFVYPDGVAAVRLGRRLGVPALITEHAPWGPYMFPAASLLRKYVETVRHSAFTIAVSQQTRRSIIGYCGEMENLRVIPNAVDGSVFTLPHPGTQLVANQILFVGIMRMVKGVDILLRALRLLLDSGREVNLAIVGESFYRTYQRDHLVFRALVEELGLRESVNFLGPKSPVEVAQVMQQSAVLVLPSRAESFGLVLAEALACGTPVVATRCGGPEDIVTPEVGALVPPEDPQALARGIAHVLDKRGSYDPVKLRAYCLENFGLPQVGRRLAALYQEALQDFHQDA